MVQIPIDNTSISLQRQWVTLDSPLHNSPALRLVEDDSALISDAALQFIRDNTAAFREALPFNHLVVDDFFKPDIADALSKEFLDYDSERWFCYKNSIEDKKAQNNWNEFPPLTYQAFAELNSAKVVNILSDLVGTQLFDDPGLHGGGWHIHGTGGNLNPHLDYSIHPKLKLQRKINIIVYLSQEMKPEYGGHLGLWGHDEINQQPAQLEKEVVPQFNRALIFDTTQNSWHGLSQPLTQPQGIYRKSFAIYYLCHPPRGVDPRGRALYAPREDQKNDPKVAALIKARADVQKSTEVYRDK